MPDGTPFAHLVPPDASSALGRGVAVLFAILRAGKPPSLSDLADITGLPRPTVFRLVRQLEETQLITRAADGATYTPGPNLMTLASDALTAFAQTTPVHAILRGLVHDVGESCNVGVLDRDGVIYIERVECDWPLRLQIGVGSRVPLHATAIGKLMMAHMPTRTRKRIFATGSLERFTENTITDPKTLEAQFKLIRRQGYATNDQENTIGLIGLAVPIYDTRGKVVAGLSLHAPLARMTVSAAIEQLPRFRDAARWIEDAMRDRQTPQHATEEATS